MKLTRFVAERLEVVGLAPPRLVSASYLTLECSRCGLCQDARQVARSQAPEQFVCERCGETQDRNVCAAANLARRSVWLRLRVEEKRANVPEGERTPWERYAAQTPVEGLTSPASTSDLFPQKLRQRE